MLRVIEGFDQDDTGDWVACLDCLHRVHVRHEPPFQVRPWVIDERARTDRIGTALECVRCDRAELPDGLLVARTAGPFDATTLPAGLRRPHHVASKTWGLLRVRRGSVVFEMADHTRTLVAGDEQAIPPEVEHTVTLGEGAQIEIDFLLGDG